MSNVLIVGFGNIGLRHCQSLINLEKIKKIYIYDIDIEKIKNFKNSIKEKKKIIILKNLNPVKNKLLLTIISTNSNVRFSIFKKIVKNFNVKFFIFEKVVFQDPKEYELTKKIIIKRKIKSWINCPRRTWSIYKNLKKKIIKNEKVSIVVSGSKWGLLSNSVHFLDLFVYLTGRSNLDLNFDKLDKKFFETKRKGFFETQGNISVKTKFGDKLKLIDKKKQKKEKFIFKLKQRKTIFYYDQFNPKNNFKAPYQSEETIKHVKNILTNNKCNLPSYLKTFKYHKLFSQNLNNILEKRKKSLLFT